MPAPAVPADAAAILARLNPRSLVRYLAENPDSRCGDIREAIDAPVSSLTRDLRQLVSTDVVTTEIAQPLVARRGRAPCERLDADRVVEILRELRAQLLGQKALAAALTQRWLCGHILATLGQE